MKYSHYLSFRNFPATLKANDGSITKILINSNLPSTIPIAEVFCSNGPGPEELKIMRIPMIPKAMDAQMKIRVAIFCMM